MSDREADLVVSAKPGERLLPLEGGRNFRDLGGYETVDGRRVKWGKIFRSGSMARLTAADHDYLADYGIRVVCDLRTRAEREAEPNEWAAARQIAYFARDYDFSVGELGKLLTSGTATAEDVRATMHRNYREIPFEQAPAYAVMFGHLAAGEVPLVVNCSAGKDRAGTGAALILSALGVPRETVAADYALSADILRRQGAYDREAGSKRSMQFITKLAPEIVEPVMASDPAYIEAMFASLDERHGSVEGYLRDVLGVSETALADIRRQLLE